MCGKHKHRAGMLCSPVHPNMSLCRPFSVTYLSVWPIVLFKNGVIGVRCTISDQHNGLAAETSSPTLIELKMDKKKCMKIACIHKDSKLDWITSCGN